MVTLTTLLVVSLMTLVLSIAAAFGSATLLDTPGATGPQGAQGQQGVPGERGHRGTRGKQGKIGKNGANGTNGVAGATIIDHQACSNDLAVPLPYC